MRTLNLGILAHVDAGKTSLTERLLHAAGVIDEVGSVDDGSTQTDILALERQRGITIKAAVVSFVIGDVTVNLIDTPGHPDFIAEVERVLGVLDGAVLVISAVEGVQAQTRVLMRTLQRLGIPTLLFVNKIDRVGARERRLARARSPTSSRRRSCRWARRVTSAPAAPTFVPFTGDELDLQRWPTTTTLPRRVVDDDGLGRRLARRSPRRPSRWVHPVFFGSAITGAGVDVLTEGITDLLPGGRRRRRRPARPARCSRSSAARRASKIAFVRLFSGDDPRAGPDRSASTRHRRSRSSTTARLFGGRPRVGRARSPRCGVSAMSASATRSASAGAVTSRTSSPRQRSRPSSCRGRGDAARCTPRSPSSPSRTADRPAPGRAAPGALRVALRRGAEGGHPGDARRRVRPRRRVPGDDADLRRAAGRHRRAIETCRAVGVDDPFLAGSVCGSTRRRTAPASSSGCEVELGVAAVLRSSTAMDGDGAANAAPRPARLAVTDCTVTLTHSRYAPRQSHSHQGFSKAMSSIGSDFRHLTPLVLLEAVRRAGTVVCEPIHRYELEIPADVLPVDGADARPARRAAARADRRAATPSCSAARSAPRGARPPAAGPGPDPRRGRAGGEFDRYRPVRARHPSTAAHRQQPAQPRGVPDEGARGHVIVFRAPVARRTRPGAAAQRRSSSR